MKSRLAKIARTSLLIYAATAAALSIGQRSLMYLPDNTRVVPPTALIPGLREIALTSDDNETIVA